MKLLSTCMAILMAVTILSCHSGGKETSLKADDVTQAPTTGLAQKEKAEEQNKAYEPPSSNLADVVADTSGTVLQAGSPSVNMDWEKKIIKDATVRLELKDYHPFDKNLHASLKRYSAYIADEEQRESEATIENTMTIKVPVDKFEELLNALPGEGVKVLEKRITTQDVTGEVIDTKARIEAKKQVRERYLALLKQAGKMKDILEVQNEINSIQEDIEAGTGRVNYLLHQSSYSTVHLTYFQYLDGKTPGDETPSFFTKLKEAFANGTSIIAGFVLVMITFWPVIIAAILAWLIVKKRKVIMRQVLNKV
jgi:hypothetical protein